MSHYTHFTTEERELSRVMRAQGFSDRAIARSLNRSNSSVSREFARNSREESMIFKLCKCRKTSQPLCHYITNYVVIKTKMYVEDSLDNDIICDFLAIKRLCRHNVS